tara:strand:- start:373 stop:1011 length:639 start_codon:yes stop_codon:yes gene_type:complete
MKPFLFILFTLILNPFSCHKPTEKSYVFFLHNRFLETHDLEDKHPDYGRTEYNEILSAFRNASFTVISEQRQGNVNARDYAITVVHQIDSLLKSGVNPNKITVIGTSKGGYIAQYVSSLANNPDLNFVFIASFRNEDLMDIPDINFCGNILNIYEKSDPFGVSAIKRKENSTCKIKQFKEIELNTGLRHGFLFKALPEWTNPSIKWAKGDYD